MSNQRGARASRTNRHEAPLKKLQRGLQVSGTQDVLDSLPAPDTFIFYKARKNGHDTIKLLLGNRPNTNGSACQVWARIVSSAERQDLQPPVLFYDQEFSADGSRAFQYSRSASSLLRKATELHPPFCFLQHDPFDEATKVREMLCAIILYQAAVTDVETCAWQWEKFGQNLVQALRYIDSRDAYHQWRYEQKLAALTQSNLNEAIRTEVEKELEQEPDHDQPGDPAVEALRTSSSTDDDEYSGGTVRSSGSVVEIRPNTSLAKLKQRLGDTKFKLLDKIPPRAMTISPHSLGGSFFPFRMLIGSAKYARSKESIKVYAYLDHGSTNGTSMKFFSHDSKGHQQQYTTTELLQVDLLEPLEYLINQKSYDNGRATSAPAKLRSLISYYFFIAENQGLIGDPRVTIGDGFGKRLCTVCGELGRKDFGSSDSSDAEGNEGPRNDEADFDSHSHSHREHAFESEEDGMELTRDEESDDGPSRIVRLKIQLEISSEIIRSGPVEHGGEPPGLKTVEDQDRSFLDDPLPEEALVEDAPTLELELRTSSQVTHGAFRPLAGYQTGLMNTCDASVQAARVGASSSFNVQEVQPQTTTVSNAGQDLSETALSALFMTAAGEATETTPQDSVCVGATVAIKGGQSDMPVDISNSGIEIDANVKAMDQRTEDPRLGDPQNNSSGEFVPRNISSPAPTPSRSRASSVASKMSRFGLVISDALVAGRASNQLAAQVGSNTPPTPEDSAERDLKGPKIPADTSVAVPQTSTVIDAILISDDEDESLALSPPRTAIDRTLQAGRQPRMDVVNLTQLSSSPRGKKRKSLSPFHLSDSKNDVIAETDGSEWRRKSRDRRG